MMNSTENESNKDKIIMLRKSVDKMTGYVL